MKLPLPAADKTSSTAWSASNSMNEAYSNADGQD
jgi:hypothetical protein